MHLAAIEPRAAEVMAQFFAAELDNERTRRAYKKAAADFFHFAAPQMLTRLSAINALHVSSWITDMKARGLAVPTIKQRLAGLRMLFGALAREQVIRFNPVSVVKGPKHKIDRGKTPVLDAEEVDCLLTSIEPTTLIGLRDRAMIAVMAYTFARISAVTSLKMEDVFHQKQHLWLRLTEKGGKVKDVPCHHVLREYIAEWIAAAKLEADPAAPVFQSFAWEPKSEDDACTRGNEKDAEPRKRILTGRPITQAMAWEMVQRRARRAGIKSRVCNHSFRAAGITAYLKNNGTIERAAHIAGHASTRTTQLYDRRPDDVTLDEIEKIRFT
jgi:site-specific recombinase XerD